MPSSIVGKDPPHEPFRYFYLNELKSHNARVAKIEQLLSKLNDDSQRVDYLEVEEEIEQNKLKALIQGLEEIKGGKISLNNMKN